METLILFARFIIAVLPFLNRKSKLKGKWRAEYSRSGSKQKLNELIELSQLSSLVWGTIKPIDNPADPEWKCYGLNRDQVLVGIYFSAERLHHWQGSFTLVLSDHKDKLVGHYSGFEESTQSIVMSPYVWHRLAS